MKIIGSELMKESYVEIDTNILSTITSIIFSLKFLFSKIYFITGNVIIATIYVCKNHHSPLNESDNPRKLLKASVQVNDEYLAYEK